MKTKRDCKNLLAKVGGSLLDDSGEFRWEVDIEAPEGTNWGDVHCSVVSWFKAGSKSSFWDEVYSRIVELGDPVKCGGWCCADHGECEYWGE